MMHAINDRLSALSLALIFASIAGANASDLQPIEIAGIVSLTGPYSDVGFMEARALDTEIRIANEHGGIDGRPLTLHLFDDQSHTGIAYLLANRIVKAGQASAVIGGSTAPSCQAILLATGPSHVVQFCLSGDRTPGATYFSSFAAPQRIFGEIPAAFMTAHRLQRVAIITRGNHTGRVYDQALETALANTNLDLIQSTQTTTSDETRAATDAALNARADVIYAGGDRRLEMDVLQQVRNRHKKTTVWLTDSAAGSPDAITLSTVLPRGPVYTTTSPVYVAEQLPDDYPRRRALQKYVKTFANYNSGLRPNVYALVTADAARFIISGLRTVNGDGSTTLAETIEGRGRTHGLYSDYHFSPTHHNAAIGSNAILRMERDGSFRYVEALSPFEAETVTTSEPKSVPNSPPNPEPKSVPNSVPTLAPTSYQKYLATPTPFIMPTPLVPAVVAPTPFVVPPTVPTAAAPTPIPVPLTESTPASQESDDSTQTPAPPLNASPAVSATPAISVPEATAAPALPPGLSTPLPVDTE
jgi:branched-chain amino acid transport system substrate-binding protein